MSEIVANTGGARSTKSYSLAQLLIALAVSNPKGGLNIGICRKTMASLRMTSYRLLMDLLKQYGLYDSDNHNKSENWYDLFGNRLTFFGLDQLEKLKSTDFNYLWMEEATEFTFDDYILLLTRLSTPPPKGWKRPNQLFLSYNPSDTNSWLRTKLLVLKNVTEIHSTFLDNPFLPEQYIRILRSLKAQDENAWKVYGKGEWGEAQHLIYSNWDLVDKMPTGGEHTYGLDFGFNNPMAVVEVCFYDGELYEHEHVYQSGLTTPTLITRLEKIIHPDHGDRFIFADSAEPDRIKEIEDAGFNVHPAEKRVSAGIDSVQRYKEHLTKESTNLIKEQRSYQWKRDKNGNVLDSPVKFMDHLMDGKRYAVHSYLKQVAGTEMPDDDDAIEGEDLTV